MFEEGGERIRIDLHAFGSTTTAGGLTGRACFAFAFPGETSVETPVKCTMIEHASRPETDPG